MVQPKACLHDRAVFLEQRRAMAQAWADSLDELEAGREVMPVVRARRLPEGGNPAVSCLNERADVFNASRAAIATAEADSQALGGSSMLNC